MKTETAKLAKSAIEMQEDMNSLSIDRVNEMAPKTEEPLPQEESLEQIAKKEGTLYIKPKRRLSPPLGTLPEKLKSEHKRAWEYVKGIYENYVVNGEPITFSLCLYPGDADYMWEIPPNIPVYVPRMVAKHLEEVQKYHSFGFIERAPNAWQKDEFTHQFAATGTHFRGKFRPIGAFA
jgi:hypothetical protein